MRMKNLYPSICVVLATVVIQNSVFGQAHVATVTKYSNVSTSSISQSFASPSTTGNLIVVHLSWDGSNRHVKTVTDTKGNNYNRINGPTDWHTNYRSELWYAYDITGGGAAITVTATLNNNSTTFMQIYASEFSGISISDPLDQKSVTTGSTAAVSSGAVTTSANGELVYGVAIGASGLITKGGGFNSVSTANQNVVEMKLSGSAGSYNASFSSASGDWVAETATFLPKVILPVELSGFDAKALNPHAVKLSWVTATETNNNYFELERSHDGLNWVSAKRVEGAGNSSVATQYSVIDSLPYQGMNYYRLKQVDLDGREIYTNVVTVTVNAEQHSGSQVRVYPNPASSFLMVEENEIDPATVIVFNSAGVGMRAAVTREGASRARVDLSQLPKGVYIMKTNDKAIVFYKQ
jgi:hypothetical protein